VYQIFGRGTAELAARKPGDSLVVWGPLGNGFLAPPPAGSVIAVAGGIGQTPFLALGLWWRGMCSYGIGPGARIANPAGSYQLIYGVRSAPYLAGLDDFHAAGIPVHIATDDGSAGFHGRVTDLLERHLDHNPRPDLLVGCGPKPMLRALANLAQREELPCLVSLENHMACGFGVCFSCVAPIRQPDESTDLKRVCVEGPVFDARAIEWT
jgi:dihydroorotate dehydrogenase electron transfer subunit